MKDELNRFDLKIQAEFDEKVIQQQEVMSRAGVPGFHVTNNADEIKLQIHVFDFIQRLSEIKIPY
jgi:alpha-acetolactate decarboxylase